MKNNLLHWINYFYIALMLVWTPLQMAVIKIDGAGRIPFFLTILVFLLNLGQNKYKHIAFSKPAAIWLIWIVYAFLNMMIQGASIEISPMQFFVGNLFAPYFLLTLTCYECSYDRNTSIKLLFWAFAIYMFLGFFVMDVGTHNVDDAAYDRSFSLGNALSLNMVVFIFVICLLLKDGVYRRWFLIACMIVAFYIITVTATRKAFGAAVIILSFFAISRVKMSPMEILRVALIGLFLYLGYSYAMDNTSLGERFSEGVELGQELNTTNIGWLSFLGDRVFFYIKGWELFTQNPVTGIGLYNFMSHSGANVRLHTEYMVNLTENGLIGFFLFVLFYWNIIKKTMSVSKIDRTSMLISMGYIVALLFIALTAWIYEGKSYFVCLGIVLSYYFENKFQLNENV